MRVRIFTTVRLILLMSLFLVVLTVQAQEPELQEAPKRQAPPEPVSPHTGYIPPQLDLPHLSGQRVPDKLTAQALPGKWDWREHGKVTPVRDQGACGSCYAFAAVANFESRLLMDSVGAQDLSENHAKECNWWETGGTGLGSCSGGSYDMIVNLLSKKGTVLESCDPYVPSDVVCKPDCPYQQTLLGWGRVASMSIPDTEVLKSYIYNYGPVFTAMNASVPGFSSYDGSYTIYHPGIQVPDHAVLIVGWDDSLTHAGGEGGWIVKNSWGTGWGGPCGYGAEAGYFTVAYGSASIGMDSSFVYDWQDYDTSGSLLYYDEAGNATAWGCTASTTAWGLAKFLPGGDMTITRVEFWTSDATTDVGVYLYDDFDGTTPTNPLAENLNNSFAEAGYHSVALDSPLPVTAGDDVIAVVKFTNDTYGFPVVADSLGPSETEHTYISCDGSSGSWTDVGQYAGDDVGIRLRATDVTAPAMHVRAIAMFSGQWGPWYIVVTFVGVVDADGQPVSGAAVDMDTELPGGELVKRTGMTQSRGVAWSFVVSREEGTYTSTVTDLSKAGWVYDSDADEETSKSLVVP